MTTRLGADLTLEQIDDWFRIGKKVSKTETAPRSTLGGRDLDPLTGRASEIRDEPFVPSYKRYILHQRTLDLMVKGNMTRKQSFKCSRSSMIFLHSPSNAVTKCLLLLSVTSFFTWTSLNILEAPSYELHICAITTHCIYMHSDWPKIWHKNYYNFNLLQNCHFTTDFN